MKIYVVQGMSGGHGMHSDKEVWLVKAFKDRNEAKEFVEEASKIAREIYKHNEADSDEFTQLSSGYYKRIPNRYTINCIGHHPEDPNFKDLGGGIAYSFYEVELK